MRTISTSKDQAPSKETISLSPAYRDRSKSFALGEQGGTHATRISREAADLIKLKGLLIEPRTGQALALDCLKQVTHFHEILERRMPQLCPNMGFGAIAACRLFREVVIEALRTSLENACVKDMWYDDRSKCYFCFPEEAVIPPDCSWVPVRHVAAPSFSDDLDRIFCLIPYERRIMGKSSAYGCRVPVPVPCRLPSRQPMPVPVSKRG